MKTLQINIGQLISKGLFGILNSSKNERKKGMIVLLDWFCLFIKFIFLEELKTPKSPFEISWLLERMENLNGIESDLHWWFVQDIQWTAL